MRLSSTTTQRTYRHLRLAVIGAAIMVLLAAVIVTFTDGPLTSLSAMYYTSGRTVFTGALFAIGLALLALSGHSVEQVLLDIAAPFALLIAIVPTPIPSGALPAGAGPCPPGVAACSVADAAALGTMRTGVIAVAVMCVVGAVTALIVAILRRPVGTPPAVPRGVSVPALVAVLVAVGLSVWLTVAPQGLLAVGHYVATAVFFLLIGTVSVVSAVTARRRWRALYIVVAAGMVAALVYLVIVFIAGGAGGGAPWVLGGELALIVFFVVFWLAQTVQKWGQFDPDVRG